MEIKKFENTLNRPLNWYLDQDFKNLTKVQKIIVLDLRLVRNRFTNDAKKHIPYLISFEKSKKFLESKNYNNIYIDALIDKVYFNDSFVSLMLLYVKLGSKETPKIKFNTYIIKANNLYKIGKSSNVKNRFSNISSSNPDAILLFIFNIDIELILHEKYKSKRIIGEWFNITKDDINNIYLTYKDHEISLT